MTFTNLSQQLTNFKINHRVLAICTALLFVATVIVCALRTAHHDLDFKVYHRVAVMAREGNADIYDLKNVKEWAYRYGPSFPVLMIPFSFFSEIEARWLWGLFNGALFVGAWFYTERIVRRRFLTNGISHAARILTLLMMLDIVSRNAIQGNVNVLMYFLTVRSLDDFDRGNKIGAGFFAALGATIKIYPGAIVIFYLARKSFKTIGYFAAFSLMFLIALPALFFGRNEVLGLLHGWYAVLTDTSYYDILMAPNQSVYAVIWRLLGSETLAFTVMVVATIAALGTAVALTKYKKFNELALFCLCIPLVAMSNAFYCYFIMTLPMLMIVNSWLTDGLLSKSETVVWFIRFFYVHILIQAIVGKKLAIDAAISGQHLWGLVLLLTIFFGLFKNRRLLNREGLAT